MITNLTVRCSRNPVQASAIMWQSTPLIMSLSRSLGTLSVHSSRSSSSATKEEKNAIAAILSEPTWSIRALLPESSESPKVSSKQLCHLLRLAALPQPSNLEEEKNMLKTLNSQIHFVKEIQQVDTTGVEPLRSIRDETEEAQSKSEIGLDDLQAALAKERTVGRNGRIKRDKSLAPATTSAEDWDPLIHASTTVGRYFVVKTGTD